MLVGEFNLCINSHSCVPQLCGQIADSSEFWIEGAYRLQMRYQGLERQSCPFIQGAVRSAANRNLAEKGGDAKPGVTEVLDHTSTGGGVA